MLSRCFCVLKFPQEKSCALEEVTIDRETKIIRKFLCDRCREKFNRMRNIRNMAARHLKIAHSVFDYINRVEEIQVKKSSDEIILFRGHAKEDYELIPSLFRKDNEKIREIEDEAIRQIEIEHPRELAGMSTLDKLVMLQHYEFPTRLLDFSFNPLVALFFAANSHKEDNGAVIICRVAKDELLPFDNRIVKALASLAIMPNELKKEILEYDSEQLSSALTETIFLSNGFWAMKNISDKKLSELAIKIRNRMPPDVNRIPDLSTPVFVETKLLNPRISAQKGAFLLFGMSDEFPESTQREKIIIPGKHKITIMKELEQFGIDESNMFLSFEHFLRYLREKMKRGE